MASVVQTINFSSPEHYSLLTVDDCTLEYMYEGRRREKVERTLSKVLTHGSKLEPFLQGFCARGQAESSGRLVDSARSVRNRELARRNPATKRASDKTRACGWAAIDARPRLPRPEIA